MPIQNPADIRLNERDDLEAIIGNPPGWTLRWGMTVVLGVVALVVFLAWLVRYPDVVETRAILTTEQPPIRLVAKVNARLEEFNASNGQAVKKGEILGTLENPAEVSDVFELDNFLNKLSDTNPSSYLSVAMPSELKLGSLEASFVRLEKRFSELKHFLKKDINYLKISNLRKQIIQLERLNRSLGRQAGILSKEVNLAYSGYRRDSILLVQKSLSRLEYEATQSALLRKRRELENLKSGTVQNDLRIRQMEAQILDLQQLRSDDESELVINFQSEIESLQAEIDIWKNIYLLTAPISGEVVLTSAWSEQQFVNENEEVLTIVPTMGAGEIIGKAYFTGQDIGKIDTGMITLLRLDAFPYQEYGVLEGRLKSIAIVPGREGYEAHISIPKTMQTSHDKHVPFRQEMQATARIVTEERSYLERILENFWATFEEN